MYSSQYGDAGRTKEIKVFGKRLISSAKAILSGAILGTRAVGLSALPYVTVANSLSEGVTNLRCSFMTDDFPTKLLIAAHT
jgi:hypothetical protein